MDDIDTFLTDRLVVRPAEKGLYGEVFTPVSVVDTMLGMLPAGIWKRADYKWCDPACGIGHFPLKAIFGGSGYPGLLTGLASQFRSRHATLKHILENMLWCYDINAENTRALRASFSELCSGAAAHVITGDFLEMDHDTPFDVIMGNPPYNSGGTKRVGEKRLHIRFTEAALTRVAPNGGHILFVCPPNYREAGSTMNMLFREAPGHFSAIKVYGPNETHRLFKVQTRVDAFLWRAGGSKDSGKTEFVDEYGTKSNVVLDLSRHVPNFGISIFEKLRAHEPAGIRAFRTAEATTITCEKSGFRRDGTGRYPTLHLIVEGGRKVLRRVKPHSLQNTPKLLLNGLGIPYVYYDKEGKYGVTQTPVVITEPSERLYKFMKSSLFYCIVWGLRITGNNNLPYLFEDVPAGYGQDIEFTAAEQELIKKFVVPVFDDKDVFVTCSAGAAGTGASAASTSDSKRVTRRRARGKVE